MPNDTGPFNTAIGMSALKLPVFVDANGQLGTLTPPDARGTVQQPLQSQQDIDNAHAAAIAELRNRLARLEALVTARPGRRQADALTRVSGAGWRESRR